MIRVIGARIDNGNPTEPRFVIDVEDNGRHDLGTITGVAWIQKPEGGIAEIQPRLKDAMIDLIAWEIIVPGMMPVKIRDINETRIESAKP